MKMDGRNRSKRCTTSENRRFNSSHENPNFFPCPAGCGHHVSERDVNDHLDNLCSAMGSKSNSNADAAVAASRESIGVHTNDTSSSANCSPVNANIKSKTPTSGIKRKTPPPQQNTLQRNAFTYIMQQSAKVFSNVESTVKHKFHLHQNHDGIISTTWISDPCNSTIALDEAAVWSANVTVKKIKSIPLVNQSAQTANSSDPDHYANILLLLEVSSSIPFQQSNTTMNCNEIDKPKHVFNFVKLHSRLSVAHLKSILQKSIRRRAPLPSVRVAMELADKSFDDLIRRLPIIILEDSFLHPDFDLLVWLMVANSKGYVPPMSLMVRVFQIVFEMASCPRRDEYSDCEIKGDIGDCPLASISLTTPSSQLFSGSLTVEQTIVNKYETLVRAMLLRAQYGGMSCDVNMLHSFSALWLKRFQSQDALPVDTISTLPKSKLFDGKENMIRMGDVPRILHEPSRQQSSKLVTRNIICSGGLDRLTEADICSAGIDFHCSPVVENLLSQRHLYLLLCQRLSTNNRDCIANQVRTAIWNHSSGINRRRSFNERHANDKQEDSILKAVWDDILKVPFKEFTEKFIRQRL